MSRYDIEKFDPPPDPDLVCCICQCVLDKAVECPCRHVFCQICIERWLSNRHTCPTCRKRTRKADLKPVLPLVQNMLNRLMMICDYRDNGCVDKVMLENFDRHVKNCDYELKTCRFSKCGQSILRMNLEAHENEECPHREIVCDGECGLMIPLSESAVHNCVTALKAHIEEKNRMIEQLKVKLHELNNLSQSLNDQLVELRQQLNDRNRLFSEDMSDISESDITDYMSDELSPDSEFQDSWFDSTASNGSVDNADAADNDVSTNDATNNAAAAAADHDNPAVGGAGGSDVVQQVERTVVSSLFELSSRLERVRNQMRAVLNSGLVHDASTLNDEVRIPSAALDAIVNNSNGDTRHVNTENNNNINIHHSDDERNNNNENEHEDNENSREHDMSDSDISVHSGADAESIRTVDMSDNHGDSNANPPWSYSSHDSFDESWISASNSRGSATPSHASPSSIASGLGYDNTDVNDSYAHEEDHSTKDQYSSTHVILIQPPDSPSDSTGSFSSIPSTWSVENSPAAISHVEDGASSQHASSQHASSQHARSESHSSSTNDQASPYYGPKSPNYSEPSRSPFKSSESDHNASRSSHRSSGSESQSDPLICLSSHDSPYSASKRVSDWMDSGDKAETFNSENKRDDWCGSPHYSDAGSASVSSAVDYIDSTDGHKSDGDIFGNDQVSECDTVLSDMETSHLESNTHDVEAEHSCDGEEGDDNFTEVSKCEPDSTQSPGGNHVNQVLYGSLGSDANTPVVISTATDSSDSSESESLKYLTKRRRQTPSCPEYIDPQAAGESTLTGVVKIEENLQNVSTGLDDVSTAYNSRKTIDNNNASRSLSRKRKTDSDIVYTQDGKKSRSIGASAMHLHGSMTRFSPSSDSGIVPDCSPSDSATAHRYGFRKRTIEGEPRANNDSNKNNKTNGTSQTATATVTHSSHMSPSRHRSSRRETTQHYTRRNRTGASKRTPNQANVTTDNNGQSLNVKIDLSLINYAGHLNTESKNLPVPTATVVHRSANISPLGTSTTGRRETTVSHTYNRQHSGENNKPITQKTDDSSHSTHHSSHKTRSSQNQKHENQHQNRSSANSNTTPKSVNTSSNLSHRDFPNCWRDESDNSSDDVLDSGSGNSITEEDNGFESDSSYEVAVPKSTAALLEEYYGTDDSDESWTAAMG